MNEADESNEVCSCWYEEDEGENGEGELGIAMGSEEGDRVAVLDSVSERVVETDMEEGRVGRWSTYGGREGKGRDISELAWARAAGKRK